MRKIFFIVSTIGLLTLAGPGCLPIGKPVPPGPEQPVPPASSGPPLPSNETSTPPVSPALVFGTPATLSIGQSAEYGDGLVVTLKEINDSRCPKDVVCVWQGELAPLLSLNGGDLAAETALSLGTVRGLSGAAGPYAVILGDVTERTAGLTVAKPGIFAASHYDKIRLAAPLPEQQVAGPLVVTGEARGNWYFEASFPVRLLDAFGNQLAAVPAQAQGDWMTTEFVPFRAELAFAAPTTAVGTLVLVKDNPSGLPEYADEMRIPVKFSAPAGEQRRIKLYFYDSANDRDETGNVLCSRQGLSAVERDIPLSKTPIQDAIRSLLQGGLTAAERASGVSTEFPLPGVELKGASLKDGVLTLNLADPNNRTSGGSCRAGILWFQIEATAKQFPEVNSVRFLPEELFQP